MMNTVKTFNLLRVLQSILNIHYVILEISYATYVSSKAYKKFSFHCGARSISSSVAANNIVWVSKETTTKHLTYRIHFPSEM